MARIVCLHGLGGTGATMARLAHLLRDRGHEVLTPTLPGHGTEPEHLVDVTWDDWVESVRTLVTDDTVLVGQSMGGSLALAVAGAPGREGAPPIAGVVTVNALAPDPDAVDGLEWRRDRGHRWVEGAPAAPGEVAYDRLPIAALLTMAVGVAGIDLGAVHVPVLVVHGALDDAVDPGNSDVIATSVAGRMERRTMERSGHVAVLGDEVDQLADAIDTFVRSL